MRYGRDLPGYQRPRSKRNTDCSSRKQSHLGHGWQKQQEPTQLDLSQTEVLSRLFWEVVMVYVTSVLKVHLVHCMITRCAMQGHREGRPQNAQGVCNSGSECSLPSPPCSSPCKLWRVCAEQVKTPVKVSEDLSGSLDSGVKASPLDVGTSRAARFG